MKLDWKRTSIPQHSHINILSPTWTEWIVFCLHYVDHSWSHFFLEWTFQSSLPVNHPGRLRKLTSQFDVLSRKNYTFMWAFNLDIICEIKNIIVSRIRQKLQILKQPQRSLQENLLNFIKIDLNLLLFPLFLLHLSLFLLL